MAVTDRRGWRCPAGSTGSTSREAGELVVVDYKTGRWVPDTDDARGSLALAVYALAAGRTLRRPCRRVELHHLPTGRSPAGSTPRSRWPGTSGGPPTPPTTSSTPPTALTGGADVDAAYPPVPGRQCAWCDFRRHCPAGRAAAPEQPPWAGLAQPATVPPDTTPGED